MDCIFCKIIKKEIPADTVLENEHAVVFKDINPKAPVHLLVVPRKHIATLNDVKENDEELAGKILLTAKEAAKKEGISESGYRLQINVGEGGGQEVFHLHIHVMGGSE